MDMTLGRFVVLEGPDGAGKTTVAKSLCELLQDRAIPFIYLKSPGGTPMADIIRTEVLVRPDLSNDVRLFSMLLSMLSTTVDKVMPNVQAGTWVVMDRYLLSTLVYQGLLAGKPLADVQDAIKAVFKRVHVKPDAYIVLNVSPETSVRRISERGDARTVFESDTMLARMNAAYSFAASLVDEPVFYVDGEGQKEEVWRRTRNALTPILPREYN